MPRQQQEEGRFPDIRGGFNAAVRITDMGAAMIRPLLLSGQGIRAYGWEALAAFLALPVIATFARSEAIVQYWYGWTILYLFRRLTPDRRRHTRSWGSRWLTRLLTLGLLPEKALLVIEPLLVFLAAHRLTDVSRPLSNLLAFAALSLAFQYRLMSESIRREREARHDAAIEAERYRHY